VHVRLLGNLVMSIIWLVGRSVVGCLLACLLFSLACLIDCFFLFLAFLACFSCLLAGFVCFALLWFALLVRSVVRFDCSVGPFDD
jgi:hypothetical protein